MKRKIAVASVGTILGVGLLAATLTLALEAGPIAASAQAAPGPELIPAQRVAREAGRSVLQVHNQTPFIVIVHVDDVRVGWMRPYRTGLIRGLRHGYHRLYAYSQYGTVSFGPRESWVPGTWNIIY